MSSRCYLLEKPSGATEREIGIDAGGEPCSPPCAPDKRYRTAACVVSWLMLSRVVCRVSDAARTLVVSTIEDLQAAVRLGPNVGKLGEAP